MGFTLTIYIGLFIFMLAIAYGYKNCAFPTNEIWMWIGVVVYALIIGCRYDVGLDYMSYKYFFIKPYLRDDMETKWLATGLKSMDFTYISFFIIIAFLQIYIFLKSFKDRRQLVIWGVFFYFTTLQFFLSMNVMRQSLAWCIFLYSVRYIQKRELVQYIICIGFALLFHSSALILIPFYYIYKLKIRYIKPVILLYAFLFVFGTIFKDALADIAGKVAVIIGYEKYGADMASTMQEFDFEKKDSSGLASMFWFLMNLATIFLSTKLRKIFDHQGFDIIYTLFLLGIMLDCIIGGTILDRITMYFLPFRIIIFSFLFCYISKSKEALLRIGLCTAIVGLIFFYIYSGIIGGASGCSPFQFADIDLI